MFITHPKAFCFNPNFLSRSHQDRLELRDRNNIWGETVMWIA